MKTHDPAIYRTLLESLSDGVLVLNFNGVIQIANPAFCRMFKLEPDTIIGQTFGDVFVPLEGLDEFTQVIFDLIVERGGADRQVADIRIDGKPRSLTITTSYLKATPEDDADQMAVIATVSDITEVRELRETELRMAKVIETQLGELQDAYHDLEARSEMLSLMTKKVRAARGTAVLFVAGLFLAIGTWYIRPLDLFISSAPPDAYSTVEPGEPGAWPTLTLEPREFQSTIALRGRLEPGRVVKVVSPIESHVSEVHAAPGQRLAAGDLLVEFETDRLMTEHRGIQIEHIRARDRLAELEDWENSAEMARARRALRQAKIALGDAEQSMERAAFLLNLGIVPVSEHEQAQRNLENRLLDVESAELELEGVKEKGGEQAKRVARLEAETALTRLQMHEEKLKQTQVRAPISGIVIAAEGPGNKPLTKGRSVAQGELLLTLADFDHLSVTARVDEVDVRKLKAGQRAWVTGPGFPGLRVEGVVERVSSQAGRGARRSYAPEFDLMVALARLEEHARDLLRVGMSAHVTIVVYHRPAALLVPLDAVQQAGGQTWVRVRDRKTDTIDRRAVELGLTTLDSVEVVTGLSAGDEIVLPDAAGGFPVSRGGTP